MEKPHTNETDKVQYAADGTRVMPGQTRTVRDLSGTTPGVPVPDITDPMHDLSRAEPDVILSRLIGLDVHQLAALLAFEEAGQDRGDVKELIKLRQLELDDAARMDAAPDVDAAALAADDAELTELAAGTVDHIRDQLADLTDEGLSRLAEIEAAGAGRTGVAHAIAAEQEKRAKA